MTRAALLMLAACAAHPQLHGTYADLHALDQQVTETTACGRYGCSTRDDRTLHLANGTTVAEPIDLLPVVAPASATAAHAHRAHDAWVRGAWFIATGSALAIAGAATTEATDHRAYVIGGLSAAVIAVFAWYYERDVTDRETRAAFDAYNADLRAFTGP